MENNKKKIYLITPFGFCFGVKNSLNKVREFKKINPNYKFVFKKMIVHDSKTNSEALKQVNASLFNTNDNYSKKDTIFVFPAHGTKSTEKNQLEKEGYKYLDCICPILIKTKKDILNEIAKGNKVIFFGKENHDETIFFINEIKDLIFVDYKKYKETKLNLENDKFVIFPQSTISLTSYLDFQTYLKDNNLIPKKVYPICSSCLTRWEKLKDIEDSSNNIYIIFGSNLSSNATEFYHLACKYFSDKRVYFISDLEKLKENLPLIEKYDNIYLMSATSFSNSNFEECLSYLKNRLTINDIFSI